MVIASAAVCVAMLALGFGALWSDCRRRLAARTRGEAALERRLTAATQAAQQAGEEAARLREALDALAIPIWRRRHDRALVDCNRNYAAALGASREVVLAEGRELVRAGRGEPLAPDVLTPPAVEIHRVIDGRRRLLEVREVACADRGTIGYALDRTDVESSAAELHRHLDAHAAVLEGVSAAVAIFGPDQRLRFFNSAFTRLWALDPGWLATEPRLGEIFDQLRASRSFPEFADFRAFKRERGEMFTSLIEPRQEQIHLPDGRTLHLTVSPHPLGGLIFAYDDVSDRLALECSYNTLIQVQRATLDHLFEGIAVYGCDGRLKLHNPAFRAIWGLSQADVAGEPHIAEIVEKTRDLIDDCGDWAAYKAGIVADVTTRILRSFLLDRRDGSVLQVASVPLPDGEVLLTYLDVSDTARVERALRERNEALETAGRLKSEFIASVSHELRTPLSTIIGFAEILNNQYFGPLNSSQTEYGRGILDSSHQLMTLIDDILDLATIEAGYMELARDRVEIVPMLHAVSNLTRERARSRGLEISVRCPPKIGAIEADERRLKQALFNLISNAIKFTPPGGAIGIEAERRGGALLLSVADTGIGIAPADQLRVFDKFARGKRHASSGLGLSLVKSLIELHGGTVAIESAPGRGTRVTCQLPASREPDADHATAPTGAAGHIDAAAATSAAEPMPVY